MRCFGSHRDLRVSAEKGFHEFRISQHDRLPQTNTAFRIPTLLSHLLPRVLLPAQPPQTTGGASRATVGGAAAV